MESIQSFPHHFIPMFQPPPKQFIPLLTPILPTLVLLLTFTYPLIKFIRQHPVNTPIHFPPNYTIFPYTLIPILSLLIFTNPIPYTFPPFLPQKQKPPFYHSPLSFVHPLTSL
ncbi:PTS glucitol/sorbitol transporter subunit IIC, partial [Bacillus sp. WP8]|uniref:PTS glucitol/sorbitol transporter subunit IIC n=1 Tax=Bacillus sp. WP8 TaxID=756828 RepID=UPI0028CB4F2B